MPEAGPFGETFFEARVRAMVAALFVNNPDGGCVESVFTLDTHFFPVRLFPVCLFFVCLFLVSPGICLLFPSAGTRTSEQATCAQEFDAWHSTSVAGNPSPQQFIPEPKFGSTADSKWLQATTANNR